jgi:hypothetical protein
MMMWFTEFCSVALVGVGGGGGAGVGVGVGGALNDVDELPPPQPAKRSKQTNKVRGTITLRMDFPLGSVQLC